MEGRRASPQVVATAAPLARDNSDLSGGEGASIQSDDIPSLHHSSSFTVDSDEDFEEDFSGVESLRLQHPSGDRSSHVTAPPLEAVSTLPPLISSPANTTLKSSLRQSSSINDLHRSSSVKKKARVGFVEAMDVISYEAPAVGAATSGVGSDEHDFESTTLPPRYVVNSRVRRRILGQRRDTFDLVQPPAFRPVMLNHDESKVVISRAQLGRPLSLQSVDDTNSDDQSLSETRPHQPGSVTKESKCCSVL